VTGGKWRLSSSSTNDATCFVAGCSNSIEGNAGAVIHDAFARSKPFEVHFLDSIVRTRSRCVDFGFALATDRVATFGRDTSPLVGSFFFDDPQNVSFGLSSKESANCFFSIEPGPSISGSLSADAGLLCWPFPMQQQDSPIPFVGHWHWRPLQFSVVPQFSPVTKGDLDTGVGMGKVQKANATRTILAIHF
jgi:hypothetical protein